MQAYQDGEWDRAETYFEQALEVDPSSPDIHYWMGEAYRRSQHPTEAMSEFATTVNLGAGFAPSYLGVAYLDLAAGKPNDALDQAGRAIELDPNFAEAYLLRADLLARKGDSQGAFENLQRAVQVAPQNALALALLGGMEVTQGNLDAAWRDATRSQALDPTELESYLALGRAYLAMGLPKEAVSQLLVYTVYESGDAAGWTDLGDALLASKDFGSADDAFAAALRLDSHIADAWIGRSEALGMEGRFAEGAAVAAQAAALLPNSTPVLAQYGRALISAGEGEEAVSVLTGAMGQALAPEELGTLLSLRAEAYKLLGDARLAEGDWNELVGLSGAPEHLRLDAYDELRALGVGSPSPTPQ
jgi:tetratricopeptide (TPR) repeat protein